MLSCIIVGGGIIGMMTARAFKKIGFSVILLEKNICGTECSWAGGGIISPLYPWYYEEMVNRLSAKSQKIYPALCAELLKHTGIDSEYYKSGLLMLDHYNNTLAKAWLNKYMPSYQIKKEGILFDEIAQVRSPNLLRALKLDLIKRGVVILEKQIVTKIIIKNNSAFGVRTNHKSYYADFTIICSGAWSSSLNITDDVYPLKGQMILLKAKAGVVPHILLDNYHYIIPRKDGRVLVGSTCEDVGFDKSLDKKTKHFLLHFAYQHYPALKNALFEKHWAGLRPATHSGKINIGKHAKYENLYLNVGHSTNGFSTAPASANMIRDLIYSA